MALFMDKEYLLFDGATAASSASGMLAIDRQHVILTLSSASSANFTIKIQGSNSIEKPDFSAARTVSNRREYIQVKDLENAASIDGDTGVSFAGTDDVRMFEVNTNRLRWVSATITARSAGAITLSALWVNNQ